LNGDDEEVPVMDDFNREKRLFTVSELKDFVNTTLVNYFGMENSTNEFEDYTLEHNATMFVVSQDPKQQNSTLIHIHNEPDIFWGYPFNLSDTELKSWIRDVQEFQILFKNIKIVYP
jgi:hypothetical protein